MGQCGSTVFTVTVPPPASLKTAETFPLKHLKLCLDEIAANTDGKNEIFAMKHKPYADAIAEETPATVKQLRDCVANSVRRNCRAAPLTSSYHQPQIRSGCSNLMEVPEIQREDVYRGASLVVKNSRTLRDRFGCGGELQKLLCRLTFSSSSLLGGKV